MITTIAICFVCCLIAFVYGVLIGFAGLKNEMELLELENEGLKLAVKSAMQAMKDADTNLSNAVSKYEKPTAGEIDSLSLAQYHSDTYL